MLKDNGSTTTLEQSFRSEKIFGSLDCGYTLGHWMPSAKAAKRAWNDDWNRQGLSRWIVLDTGKIREGKPLAPIVYELVGQEMAEGEGDPIGVLRLATEDEAGNVLLDVGCNVIAASELARAMLETLGEGKHTVMSHFHKSMNGVNLWPRADASQLMPSVSH